MATDSTLAWQDTYAHVLNELDAVARSRVVDTIQSNVIEGFAPTADDVRFAVDHALGRVDLADFIARVTKTTS
jgi:hypothetical protein